MCTLFEVWQCDARSNSTGLCEQLRASARDAREQKVTSAVLILVLHMPRMKIGV